MVDPRNDSVLFEVQAEELSSRRGPELLERESERIDGEGQDGGKKKGEEERKWEEELAKLQHTRAAAKGNRAEEEEAEGGGGEDVNGREDEHLTRRNHQYSSGNDREARVPAPPISSTLPPLSPTSSGDVVS